MLGHFTSASVFIIMISIINSARDSINKHFKFFPVKMSLDNAIF